MIFVLEQQQDTMATDAGWTWRYEAADGTVHARSAQQRATEKEARSDIAKARRAFGGCRFAKVVVE